MDVVTSAVFIGRCIAVLADVGASGMRIGVVRKYKIDGMDLTNLRGKESPCTSQQRNVNVFSGGSFTHVVTQLDLNISGQSSQSRRIINGDDGHVLFIGNGARHVVGLKLR